MIGTWARKWLTAVAAVILSTTSLQADVFEFVVLPDTEDYADFYPDVFAAQGQWIVDHQAEENIVFTTHMGDTVHHPLATPAQWDVATSAMYPLDDLMPYSVSAGNHDLEDKPGFIARFGPTHFSAYDWYGGASTDKMNSYQVFSAGGYEFLNITLQTTPGTTARNWARSVIEANPGKPTIISTHDYLDVAGRSAAGTTIWNDLVDDYPQVFMVLNGHNHGVNRTVSTNSGGKKVLEILTNYQEDKTISGETDTGYLRKIIFDTDAGKISVQTYSPTYAEQPWLTDNKNQFSYDVAFLPQLPGGTLSPIFVTDAATCTAAGYTQGFDTVPGPSGTSLPLGWSVRQISGTGDTFSGVHPIEPADVAGATSSSQTLLPADNPPGGSWGNQAGNAASGSGRALATNPGSNGAGVIQLAVTNGIGAPALSVQLAYDLQMLWSSPGDDGTQLPGYSVFWSSTGGTAAGDWTKLGEDSVAGSKAWNIALPVALNPGVDFYLRWADDNVAGVGGEAAAENVWSLDNVRVSMSATAEPDLAEIIGRYVFYGNSAFDNPAAGRTAGDAIAPDKTPLMPGETAGLANYTSFDKGINGVVIDIAGLKGTPGAGDFEFKVGNDSDPDGWLEAPSPLAIDVQPMEDAEGVDRVTITWADGSITNEWLQVIVHADAAGLAADDMFYFGNAIGEAGDRLLGAITNATDEILARNFPHGLFDPAGIDDLYDYNRDGLVNGTDQILARNNQTNPLNMLRLISLPARTDALGASKSAAVPEPSSLVLLLIGIAILWGLSFIRPMINLRVSP